MVLLLLLRATKTLVLCNLGSEYLRVAFGITTKTDFVGV